MVDCIASLCFVVVVLHSRRSRFGQPLLYPCPSSCGGLGYTRFSVCFGVQVNKYWLFAESRDMVHAILHREWQVNILAAVHTLRCSGSTPSEHTLLLSACDHDVKVDCSNTRSYWAQNAVQQQSVVSWGQESGQSVPHAATTAHSWRY